MFLYTPVLEKMWRQYELWDGTYTLDDLLDVHEALWVKNKNMQIMIEHQQNKQKDMNDWR